MSEYLIKIKLLVPKVVDGAVQPIGTTLPIHRITAETWIEAKEAELVESPAQKKPAQQKAAEE